MLLIVRWPEKIKAGSQSDETVCLLDFMATFATMLGHELPADSAEDSYDITAVLRQQPYEKPIREATVHHSVNGVFAIRQGDWKLIESAGAGDYETAKNRWHNNVYKDGFPNRDPKTGDFLPLKYDIHEEPKEGPHVQLYNLADDPKESKNLQDKHPEIVERLQKLLDGYRDSDRSVKR